MDGDLPHRVFELREAAAPRLPLIVASPHSGSEYPADFLASSRLAPLALRRSEDSFVDELFAAAPGLGAPLLSARFPRAYLDVNREAWELDPTMFADPLPRFVNAGSPRVRMGLGTIARIVAVDAEIYAGKLRFAEAQRRIENLYHPYHRILCRLIAESEAIFGGCLLVDCHSMPSLAAHSGGRETTDIVLGDCHGTACSRAILEAAHSFFVARGFSVTINAPYAGGFTTGHYGKPRRHRHALQIEINRALYMDERCFERKPGFARLAADLAEFVRRLGAATAACLPNQGQAIDPRLGRSHF
jgi:N-formylglutamate amidohydrolase